MQDTNKPSGFKTRIGEINNSYKVYNADRHLTASHNPIISINDNIFTMGSCFASEIRVALKKYHYKVYPHYESINIEGIVKRRALEQDNLLYYHTFAIRQEFERALGMWRQEDDDIWPYFGPRGGALFQDPYRRGLVCGGTPDPLINVIRQLDIAIREGMKKCKVFLITLGLIEVWRIKSNGRFACANPGYIGGGGFNETEFHLSNYEENYRNLCQTVELIRKINPSAKIVYTVSPVPLAKTFTNQDIVVANYESKSLLRTAAAQVCREYDGVYYFPSYDLCQSKGDVYEEDGRHVRTELIEEIMNLFFDIFAKETREEHNTKTTNTPIEIDVNQPISQSQIEKSIIPAPDKLTPEHINTFWENGFLLLRDFLSQEELDEALKNIEAAYARGSHHRGEISIISEPEFRSLSLNPRILEYQRALNNTDPVSPGTDIIQYVDDYVSPEQKSGAQTSKRKLHIDSRGAPGALNATPIGYAGRYSINRFAIYFQDHEKSSGGLKIAPCRHMTRFEGESGVLTYYNVPTHPRDLVIFNTKLPHSPHALRPISEPERALSPSQETEIYASDPASFLPTPKRRNVLFITLGATDQTTDLYIKNRARLTSDGQGEYAECKFDDPLILKQAKEAGLTLRLDGICVVLAHRIYKSLQAGKVDAELKDNARRLFLALKQHQEFTDHFPLIKSKQLLDKVQNNSDDMITSELVSEVLNDILNLGLTTSA